ncbi:MAG: Cof-type HAD-IIB family hydrolase [Fimbriimonadales bacterium]|nr:Cof-type HAD-IIB family hydrolase [Fimbriimonadales bacterium]
MKEGPRNRPKAPIRLLAVDLDGTLLGSDRTPHPASAEALRLCRQRGVRVVLASGRVSLTMAPFAEAIGLERTFVCCNGAHVVEARHGDVLHTPLPGNAALAIWEFGRQRGLQTNLYFRDRIAFGHRSPFGDVYLSRVRAEVQPSVTREEILRDPPTKMMVLAEPEELERHRAAAEELASGLGLRTVLSEPDYLEFLVPTADKGSGLRALCRHLGVPRESCAAIGDYSNDVEMLAWAGFSGAMANGSEDAKAAADAVVSSNDDGGVAEFVSRFVLGELGQSE